jgi:hypothetical protein
MKMHCVRRGRGKPLLLVRGMGERARKARAAIRPEWATEQRVGPTVAGASFWFLRKSF